MEGMVFYWVAWFFWVLATFFAKKKSDYRFKIAICILVLIILKPYHIMLLDRELNLAVLFLYLFLLFQVITLKRMAGLYIFITSFIIMLAYDSFLLFELYDPVWVMFKRDWMLAFLLVYLCVLLQTEKIQRFYTMLIGLVQGEFMYSVILKRINISYPIGTNLFFDSVAAVLILLFFWSALETGVAMFEQHMNQQGRGRQKST